MTPEQQPVPSIFLPEFPAPENQLLTELHFVHSYSSVFNHATPLITNALDNLAKVAGVHHSMLEDGTTDSREQRAETLAWDETRLLVAMPASRPTAVLQRMSPGQIHEYNNSDGYMLHHSAKLESTVLLRGLCKITGAEKLRDDREEGEQSGLTIRRGNYHGNPVYMVEEFDTSNGTSNFRLCSETGVDRYWNSLRESERDEFLSLSGLSFDDFEAAVEAHAITSENFEQVAHDLAQLRLETRRLGRKPLADEIELAVELTKTAVELPLKAGKLCVESLAHPFKRYWKGKRE